LRYAFWLLSILNFDNFCHRYFRAISEGLSSCQLYPALSSFCNTSPTAMGEEHFHGRMS
jgi:hypothetical protein